MTIIEKITGKDEQLRDIHAVVPIPQLLRKNGKVAILTADGAEDIEFFYPYYRLTEEGYTVDVITLDGGKFEAKHGLGLNHTKSVQVVTPEDYILLYIPGGKAPAKLRTNGEVVKFVKEFAHSGKPIAAIGHGPQVLLSAGLVKGRQLTGWPETATELENGGAMYVDEALVIDGQFITARKPGDLHRHMHGVLEYIRGAIPQKERVQRRIAAW